MNDHTTRDLSPKLCECGCGQPVTTARFPSQQRKYINGHQPNAHRPIEERFWRYVAVGDPDECWLWTGTSYLNGYGQLSLKGRHVYAHRLSWEIHFGPIPPHDSYHGTCVLHHCDNPACVNPEHLFLGTNAENIDDMIQKGRYNRHKRTNKLSESDVLKIREMAAQGMIQSHIAKAFGVGNVTISNVVLRKSWAWVK